MAAVKTRIDGKQCNINKNIYEESAKKNMLHEIWGAIRGESCAFPCCGASRNGETKNGEVAPEQVQECQTKNNPRLLAAEESEINVLRFQRCGPCDLVPLPRGAEKRPPAPSQAGRGISEECSCLNCSAAGYKMDLFPWSVVPS